jgi:hypothetical protein
MSIFQFRQGSFSIQIIDSLSAPILTVSSRNEKCIQLNIHSLDNLVFSCGTAQKYSLDQTLLPVISRDLKNTLVLGFDSNYVFESIRDYEWILEDILYKKQEESNNHIILFRSNLETSYKIRVIQKDLSYSKNLEPIFDFWKDLYSLFVSLCKEEKNIFINNFIYTNIRTWDYSNPRRPRGIHTSIGHYYEYLPELANIILKLKRNGMSNIFHTVIDKIEHI